MAACRLPDYSNEFIVFYTAQFADKLWMPQRAELIELTEHFCDWIYQMGLTDRQLVKREPKKSVVAA